MVCKKQKKQFDLKDFVKKRKIITGIWKNVWEKTVVFERIKEITKEIYLKDFVRKKYSCIWKYFFETNNDHIWKILQEAEINGIWMILQKQNQKHSYLKNL